jgi:Na+-transporting NADH:ubiquinone oxidoreductase subunit NqrD
MTIDDVQKITEIALQVIGVCSVIAAATPTPIDNAALVIVRKIIDFGALNWWNADNLHKPGVKK